MNTKCFCGNELEKETHLVCLNCWNKLTETLRMELQEARKEGINTKRHVSAMLACYYYLKLDNRNASDRLQGKIQSLTQLRDNRPKPNSLWLVIYEERYDVIRITPQGNGFFAPGQDAIWGLGNVTEWIREIKPEE